VRKQVSHEYIGALVAGRYRIEELLGAGGMARVYRAHDTTTGAKVALKRLGGRAAVPSEESARLRFRREFHTLSGLRHPRIVAVHDFGVDRRGPYEAVPYYTMELLDGADLYDAGRLAFPEAARILRDVASALAFLHVRGLLHRDLAPRNVRRTADGRAKLIDFGILATAGVTGDVAGTPSYIAPEVLRGLPLDHRVDLFGLGALAYRLLTGRSAYRVRTVRELEAAWRRPVAKIAGAGLEIPRAIEELVSSLMSLDPLARPAAAEVIERLTIAASLEPLPAGEAAHGYLASGALVGRDDELALADGWLQRAARSEGSACVIAAPSGIGKSRLLREIAVRAQIAGAIVVSADGRDDHASPYGTVHAIARALFASAGAHATEAARPRASVLARALPALIRERLGDIAPARLGRDPAEQRMRIQAALHAWIAAVARRAWVVVLIEDLQRCDEASAAVLASLAHGAEGLRLLIVATLRTDEAVRATDAVASLEAASTVVRLRGLPVEEVERLVAALFGEVPNAQRLAQKLAARSQGSPLLCVELAREMVRRGAVRYLDGVWAIDASAEIALPAGLAETLSARIAALSAPARALAEVLAMHGGPLALSECVALSDPETSEPDAVFAAIDELARAEVVVGASETYRFRHDGYREAAARGTSEARARELHLRVAEHLAPSGEAPPALRGQVGWHLLRGGSARAAAPLLAAAGRELYEAQSFREALAPLEAALEAYAEPGDARRRAELAQMLLFVGLMSERDVALRYAGPALASLRRYSGLERAERWRRFLGRPLALVAGMASAGLAWLLAPPGRRGLSPVAAITQMFLAVAFAAGVHATSWDLVALRRVLAVLEPLAIVERGVLHATHLLTRCMLWLPQGSFRRLRTDVAEILRIIVSARRSRWMPVEDMDMRAAEGAARFMRLLDRVAEQDPSYEEALRELEQLDLSFFELGGLQGRIAFHRGRGEESRAVAYEKEAEMLLVRLGSVWQMEAWLAVVSSFAYAMTRDVLGLKRAIEHLERLVAEGYRFEPALALARGEYRRESGDPAGALVEIERALELSGEINLVRLPALAALAETHLELEHLAEARRIAAEALDAASDPEVGQTIARYRSVRALALAEAADGELEVASERLDAAIESASWIASPMMCGSLHEARARVAHLAHDRATARHHLARARDWFVPTGNPVLIAAAQRLAARIDEPATAVGQSDRPGEHEATIAAASTQRDPLAGCRDRAERTSRAIDLLVGATGGQAGRLYRVERDRVTLEASSGTAGAPPPPSPEDLAVASASGEEATTREGPWRYVVLARAGGAPTLLAAIAGAPGAPEPELIERLAGALEEHALEDAGEAHGEPTGGPG
jgi:tetratricopeptide (TPR) repeat protein